jgi:hypothetical protein
MVWLAALAGPPGRLIACRNRYETPRRAEGGEQDSMTNARFMISGPVAPWGALRRVDILPAT